MDLQEVAKYVWDNSITIKFGESKEWELDTFLVDWFKRKNINRLDNVAGLYWFSIEEMSIEGIKSLRKPQDLPENGANFSEIANEIERIFEKNIRHKHDKELIIYNGQADKVIDRIRTHFVLNNDSTGALALSKYRLSKYKFKVRIFNIKLLDNKNTKDKEFIKNLLNEKVGREAIEMAWRIKYGWPILCKK